MALLPSDIASCERGTDITRCTLPAGSMTSIDIDCGSTKRLESPRYAISPPMRPLYAFAVAEVLSAMTLAHATDRKSTRLNSSHRCISYAVFCLKKKKQEEKQT